MRNEAFQMEVNLFKKINECNYNIILELIDLIIDEGIRSEKELQEYQDSLHKVNGKVLSHMKTIEYCRSIISTEFIFKCEALDSFCEINEMGKLITHLNNNIRSNAPYQEIIKDVIILFTNFRLDLELPYDAYNLIIQGKL